MSYLNKYIKRYWRLFLLAISFVAAEAFCDLLQPTVMSKIIDQGIANKDLGVVMSLGLTMFGIAACGAVSAAGRNIVASVVSQKFAKDLRGDLFVKIQSLSKENIDKLDTASLITRITNDVTQVQNFANGIMRVFIKAPLLCAGSIIMATILNPRLAIIVYTTVAAVGVLIYFNLRLGYPLFAKIQEKLDGINAVMREYLSGVRVVKAFNNYSYEESRFVTANDDLSDTSTRAMRVMAVFSPAVSFTVNMAIVYVLWFGGYLKAGSQIEVGRIIAFINYMTQLLMSLNIITNAFNMFVRAKASAFRINEVMVKENETAVTLAKAAADIDEGIRIDFNDVSFAYSGSSATVLKNISFTCEPGETIGLIGSTGCGKTTLINLLLGLYYIRDGNGSITINGLDIKDWDIKQLRRLIAVVPQKSLLFSGSILENIRWGKDDATFKEVENAASAAQADTFIKAFPNGYDTYLGQGGVNLSGGQKQRISIARALVRKPKLLILDDSTSAVDMATEVKLRQGIAEYARHMSCIIIAQRITSVMDLNKILVLDNGQVQGFGSHNELIETCEVYRDIYRSQIGGDHDVKQTA